VVWLSNARVRVRVVSGWSVDFWDPYCLGVVEVVVGRNGYVTEVVES
jgi:hypothetical protein